MDLYAVKAFTRAGRDYRTDERFSVPPVIAAILVHEGLARFAEVGDAWPPVTPAAPLTRVEVEHLLDAVEAATIPHPQLPTGPPGEEGEPVAVPARRRRRKTAVAEAE